MSFEEYLKTYGTEYIEAVAFKFYKYYFCNNKICDYEDFVQICLMKLFEQWETWDSSKSQVNTFIYMKIKGYGYTLVRDGNAQKRSGLTNEFSLDYEIDNGANKNTKLYDIEVFDYCEYNSKELKKLIKDEKIYKIDDENDIYYYKDKDCTKKIKGLFKSKKSKIIKYGTDIQEQPYMITSNNYI